MLLRHEQFERRAGAAGLFALLGLGAVFAALTYWQVLRNDLGTEPTNPRLIAHFNDPGRGRILDREGNVLAESLRDGSRRYTDASVAHAIGYIDARYGSVGAELVFDAQLSGQGAPGWEGAIDVELLRQPPRGNDIRLTIDPAIQRAAAQGLGDRKGAVIALDPKTGEVLAMVSVPTYDPGAVSTDGEELLNDPDAPLLNRAAQGLYPPGSTFKAVSAAAALEHGLLRPDTLVTCPGELVFDGFPISCANTPQGVGTYPFIHAFAYSVNAIFGQVAVDLGWARLGQTARRFGFESALPFTLDTSVTQLRGRDVDPNVPLLASTGFGQGELLATPLQMAVVAAAIANNGVQVRPFLGLSAGRDGGQGQALETPATFRVLSEEVAREMQSFMEAVISEGQANAATVPGVQVAGKTGTAETGVPGQTHAWFIGYAPAENPVVAVAVIVEDGGFGSREAAPIAGAVFRAALDR
jgi:peptidoglycan glycosyltransferase